MKNKKIFIGFIISLMAIGCTGPFTENDNDTTKELSEDDNFQIQLIGEAQSDYSWRLVSDNEIIKSKDKPIKETIGNEIEYTFNFTTSGDGDEIVQLDYSDGTVTKKSFKIRIIVGTMGRITAE